MLLFDRRDIPWILPKFFRFEDAAHDFSRPSLGERRDDIDFSRDADLAQFFQDLILDRFDQRRTFLLSLFQDDEGFNGFTDCLMRLADYGSLRDGWVTDQC